MLRAILAGLIFLGFYTVASAQDVSPGDKTEFQRIITSQIEAFRVDDGQKAYSFAAPIVQKLFPSPDTFMAMVKQGYPQVYRPQSFKFEEAALDPVGRPSQKVLIVGPNGQAYEALYTMEKQADGTWLIAGCSILEVPGVNT